MKVSFKDLGLVNTREMFAKAVKGGYAIPAFNFNNMEQLRKAAKSAVCKINIDSDSRLAMTGAIRKHFAECPGHFDPRQYLKPAREEMKKMYTHKIMNVLGSNGKAR